MGYYLTYLRKSRADEEKERYGRYETLAVHEEELARLAEREGYRVAQVYRELVSGETVQKRPEFQRVMERVQDPDCDGVMVHAIDRLGRGDPMEYGWILSTLRFANVVIVTPGRVYDPNSPDDMQQLKLQMFVSNIEFDHIRERLRRGSVESARRGAYMGSKPPYGYEKAKVERMCSLVPKDGEAEVVRTIYEMASSGEGKGAIARHLNSSGIPTQMGRLWVASKVGKLISNPVYKGYVRYGHQVERVVSRDGMDFVRRRVTNDDCICVRGVHEALVDEETWERANRLAFEAVPARRDRTIKNPLAGLIVCANCGRALVRQDVRNRYGQHFPRLHHAYGTECQCKSISLDYVMEKLVGALGDIVADVDGELLGRGPSKDEMAALRAELRREDGRLDKLIELYQADAISLSEFKERRDASRERTEALRGRIDEMESMPDPEELRVRLKDAIGLLNDGDVSAEAKNAALRRLISKVEYRELDRARRDRAIELTVTLRHAVD